MEFAANDRTINITGRSFQIECATTPAPCTIDGKNRNQKLVAGAPTSALFIGIRFVNFTAGTDSSDIYGGVMLFRNGGGPVRVENCYFANNHAVAGGAIFSSRGAVTVTSSTFLNNTANASPKTKDASAWHRLVASHLCHSFSFLFFLLLERIVVAPLLQSRVAISTLTTVGFREITLNIRMYVLDGSVTLSFFPCAIP
jgi:hypothetical protein